MKNISDEKPFYLRAHHGMCLHFYQGKGYSSTFTANMTSLLEYLQANNPIVKVIADADYVCAKCPNMQDGQCDSLDKVLSYDLQTLDAVGLQPGAQLSYEEYCHLVEEKILTTGLREKICGDCLWTDLCHER